MTKVSDKKVKRIKIVSEQSHLEKIIYDTFISTKENEIKEKEFINNFMKKATGGKGFVFTNSK